ncbi:MAG: prolyl oligopeptidase family serine peptidase [Pseudomonadota bacterium]|nr:prolyl oligopeptidase family serine peptidase [Pseudomonadota bacterium]
MRQIILLALLSAFSFGATAQPTVDDIEYYSKFSDYWRLRISPDGQHLAVGAWRDGERIAVILETKTMRPKVPVFFTNDKEEVSGFHWASNERLIVEVQRYVPSETTRPYQGGELFAINVDGSKAKRIFTYRSTDGGKKKNSGISFGGFASVLNGLESDRKKILISACGDASCSLYDMDIFNSRLRNERKLPPNTVRVIFEEGSFTPAYAVTETSRGSRIVHGKDSEGFWQELLSFEMPGGSLVPAIADKDGKTVYAVDDRAGVNQAVVKVNRNLENPELIYQHSSTDVMYVHSDINREVYGLEFGVGKRELFFLKPEHPDAKTLKALQKVFPNSDVNIVDSAARGRLLVVAERSDIAPTTYYLFNRDTNQLQYLTSTRSWVDATKSSPTEEFRFTARDGLELTGLVTLPEGYDSLTPLVVMPHGGPHGPFDTWDYDPYAQYLGHLGIAVLKVNFRGSGGYGGEFEAKGYREWGRKIQYDLVDGTLAAVEKFDLNGDKVGIMGGSFGGYSALQASIIEPDLFKAAVGVVGVYDFRLMYTAGDIRGRFSGRRYLEKAIGRDEAEFREFSPVFRADELKAPVMLIQGEKDERAPVKHSDVMARVLEEIGHPYEYIVMPNEDHGFYKPENRIRYFELYGSFLSEHLLNRADPVL